MATVTQNEFDAAYGRRSQEDHKRIMEALAADGTITIVPDEVPPEIPLEDAEGNPVEDEEGNVVMQAPTTHAPDVLTIERDNEEITEEGKIPEDYLVQVAPGTQNVAQPFPDDDKGGRPRRSSRRSSRRSKDDES